MSFPQVQPSPLQSSSPATFWPREAVVPRRKRSSLADAHKPRPWDEGIAGILVVAPGWEIKIQTGLALDSGVVPLPGATRSIPWQVTGTISKVGF